MRGGSGTTPSAAPCGQLCRRLSLFSVPDRTGLGTGLPAVSRAPGSKLFSLPKLTLPCERRGPGVARREGLQLRRWFWKGCWGLGLPHQYLSKDRALGSLL